MNPPEASSVNWNEVLFLALVFVGLIVVLVGIIALAVRGQRRGKRDLSTGGPGAGAPGAGGKR